MLTMTLILMDANADVADDDHVYADADVANADDGDAAANANYIANYISDVVAHDYLCARVDTHAGHSTAADANDPSDAVATPVAAVAVAHNALAACVSAPASLVTRSCRLRLPVPVVS